MKVKIVKQYTYEHQDKILYQGKPAIFDRYFTDETVGIWKITLSGEQKWATVRVGSLSPFTEPPKAAIGGKLRVYIFDFGDTPIITTRIRDVQEMIECEMLDMREGDELDYNIKIKYLTEDEYDKIPEWS